MAWIGSPRVPRDNSGAVPMPARRQYLPAMAAVLLLVATAGCRPADTSQPTGPGGGQAYVMDRTVFSDQIEPILTAKGCNTTECHGGGIRGTFALSPVDDPDPDFDFMQSSLQVDPETVGDSPLLRKPLAAAAGGSAHAGDSGPTSFPSTSDPDYMAVRSWIEGGEYR